MKLAGNLIFAATLIALLPSPAYAYLDAGSVSMALQVAIGAVASALMFGKLYLRKIIAVFRGKQGGDDSGDRQAN